MREQAEARYRPVVSCAGFHLFRRLRPDIWFPRTRFGLAGRLKYSVLLGRSWELMTPFRRRPETYEAWVRRSS